MDLAWLFSGLTMLLGTSMLLPQLVRVLRTRSAAGVSLTGLVSALVACAAWMVYGIHSGTASALYALAVPTLMQLVTVCAAALFGAERSDLRGPLSMLAALSLSLLVGGWGLYATVLSAAVVWSYAPAVRAAWSSPDVSGISCLSWVLAGGYGITWGALGLVEGDPAVVLNGAGNLLFPVAVLFCVYLRSRPPTALPASAEVSDLVPAQRLPERPAASSSTRP